MVSQFSIYPNPNSDAILFLDGVDLQKEPFVEIYDQFDRLVVNQQITTYTLNINLHTGVYFIKLVEIGEEEQLQKLIIH